MPKTRACDAETNLQASERRRLADVYVFALLAHSDKTTIDPLDLSQWRFYALATAVLDVRTRSQHSITLKSREALAGAAVLYVQLPAAVERAFGMRARTARPLSVE